MLRGKRKKFEANMAEMISELEFLYRNAFLSGYGSALVEQGIAPADAQELCRKASAVLREDPILNVKTVFAILERDLPPGVLMPIEEVVV